MKTLNLLCLTLLMVFFAPAITQAQTVTLTATNGQPSSYTLSTNQVITVNSFLGSSVSINGSTAHYGNAIISFQNGNRISITPYEFGLNQVFDTSGFYSHINAAFAGGAVLTGVTNISVNVPSSPTVVALTFTITTPTPQSLIPANAVVIPSDATGPVQIVLESSSDLINWTSSLPGTYGNTHSNRFFRVRAIAQ